MNIKEWVKAYNQGQEIKTVRMGGISYGYEVAIQKLAIEIADAISYLEPADENIIHAEALTQQVIKRLNIEYGYSGAQVGAAKNLVGIFWRNGVEKALEKLEDKSRIITMRKGVNEKPILNDPELPKT